MGGPEGDQVRSCIPGEFGGVILTGYSNSFRLTSRRFCRAYRFRFGKHEQHGNWRIGNYRKQLMVYPNPVRSNQELTVSGAVASGDRTDGSFRTDCPTPVPEQEGNQPGDYQSVCRHLSAWLSLPG